jgi:hypothetical protein
MLQMASEQLRSKTIVSEPGKSIRGTIVKLAATRGSGDELIDEKSALIQYGDDSKHFHVKLYFKDKEDYRKACDWHRDDKIVEVSGTLKREAKQWVMRSIDSFTEAKEETHSAH